MDLKRKIAEYAALNESEVVRKALLESEPPVVIIPPRSREDILHFFEEAEAHGLSLSEEEKRSLLEVGAYTGVTTEEHVALDKVTSITAMRLPRYMGRCLHTQECFEVVCVLRGVARQAVGDLEMDLREGDVCIIAPDVMHDANVREDGLVISILVRRSNFDRAFFRLFREGDPFYSFFSNVLYGNTEYPYLLFHTGSDDLVKEMALEILEDSLRPREYSGSYRFACISVLFLRLLRFSRGTLQIGKPSSQNRISMVSILEYIQANYAGLDRDSLARAFHYTPEHMTRLIKQATGRSFSELLTDIRLTKAQELLLETDLTVGEIAAHVGYSSVSNFHKLFRKKYGKHPSEFR